MEAKLEYMKWYRNKYLSPEELVYLKSLRDDDEKIEELFGSDVEFTSEGMKGLMGVGMSRVNKYQIARATQAFSNDIIRKAGGKVGKGVAIAFDTGKLSKEFSDTVARILLGNGIGTALFLEPKSVLQLSFAIRYLDLEGGIMITAGVDAKDHSGLKFYNSQGALMSDEDMKTIIQEFKNITEFSQVHSYVGYLRLDSIHHKIGISNDTKFRKSVLDSISGDDFNENLKIVYTPLHGTGAGWIPEVLKERGFKNVYVVKEQMNADGSFSTVEKPDPMDYKALEMAISLAKEKDADIILATDPGCEKIAIAVKNEDGEYIMKGSVARC